ncbi:MAG: glycosyltransferase family 39 protein [Candidatus Niyogibacteria bacterium]|nr:MAG: glycosyltransferase family 39 protein [Candidatus Niyogibacteria bacterium]
MKTRNWLILILILAAVLRFWGLSRGDTVNDEVFYGFRAVGLMDFDEAAEQTTPLEWLDPNIPSWTKLSFHDHPPLVFWVQHFSILLFGENNFALRFPSAVLGILSVYLLYLIGRRLYSARAGLVAAALMAVTLNSVYISRTGLQEAFVIFFLLLASYFFLRSLDEENYLIWLGAALGLGFLTKYNVFVLVPIFTTYLLFFRRDYFLNKKLWLGGALAAIIFSPVIIYNIKLYQTVGHFDFQFSYIFGQNPEVWKIAPGKEIGGLTDRLKNFVLRFIASNSWLFLGIFAAAASAALVGAIKKRKEFLKENSFLLLASAYLLLLLAAIGPSYRFLTMLTPFMALGTGVFLNYIYKSKIFLLALGVFLAFEIFYSFNNQITYYPIGPQLWLSSKVRYENYNWGYNALGDFFKKELKEKMPAIRFDARYKFIEKAQDKSLELAQKNGFEPFPAMIITYGNFDRGAKLWVLDRLHIYHGWPVIDLDTYFKYLSENGPDYYERVGFKHYYFVLAANIVPSYEFQKIVGDTKSLSVLNPRGDETFRIYKF